MQVFDDEDDRPLAREGLEEHRDALVQLPARDACARNADIAGPGCRELGQQRNERRTPGADGLEHAFGADLGDERAERGLHGRVRRRDAAEIDALPREEQDVARQPALELADQAGLADARLAADDDRERRARANLVESLVEPREVCVAADHGRR